MVAASSNHALKPAMANDVGKAGLESLSGATPSDSPSINDCTDHLRLLAAFTSLRHRVSQFGVSGSSEAQSTQRWVIYIAAAVSRFEKWLPTILNGNFNPSLTKETATDPSKMDDTLDSVAPLAWTEDMLPPLDILMVFHSYMLNPHDFLQDCLRNGAMELWKAGFPWDMVARSINNSSLEYDPPSNVKTIFEERTKLAWSELDPSHQTELKCPSCSKAVPVPWAKLYAEDVSQMEKGNTPMSFKIACPSCDAEVTQGTLARSRARNDLRILLDRNIVLPGTLLSKDGLIPSAKAVPPIEPSSAFLSHVLSVDMAEETIRKIDSSHAKPSQPVFSSCALNDNIIEALIQGSILQNVSGMKNIDEAFAELMTSARRMKGVYDRNFSPFALDLVGAVIRQGVFIEKMHYFDWVHSPAVEHTISCAIDRYAGFFKVMQQNPAKTAVPTFDVDLIWHTQQLTPAKYYAFSLKNCNGTFIDHDDKIVEDVLNNSFEWTCDQFRALTGNEYDKCLCWCCALLESDKKSSKESDKKLTSRFKGLLKSLKRTEEPSEAEYLITQIQGMKFERAFETEMSQSEKSGGKQTKKEFFEKYIWHYPQYAPHPEEVGAT
jgi:hypothetical protein